MKVIASALVSLLASVVTARPRAMEEGDPLPQKSRITAFLISDKGEPMIECWEIAHLVENQRMQRLGDSKAAAYELPLATSKELDRIDILTWPASHPIWPPPMSEVRTEWFNLAGSFNLFTVQGGLLDLFVNVQMRGTTDEAMSHIFSMENGDDWFYFEDQSPDNYFHSGKEPYPFTMRTVSGSKTEMLRLNYKMQPKHKVVHKGACMFTGIKTPDEQPSDGEKYAHGHSPFTVQVHVEESL